MSKVFVMMSGGVDSSVAASILKDQGHDVVGVFMKCWSIEQLESMGVDSSLYGCFWEEDSQDAALVADKLRIPFYIWDFQKEYKQRVVDYMIQGYKQGITPNPDMMCNSEIKFGVFFDRAMNLGADFVATGHYARSLFFKDLPDKNSLLDTMGLDISKIDQTKDRFLLRGLDINKDQSYFLGRISRQTLNKTFFPIGEIQTKAQVRQIAENKNLITANKKDSQGLCFIGTTPLRELLLETLGTKMGDIVDITGKILGTHPGAYLYTPGQRHGLGLSGGPFFVKKVDVNNNKLVVSHFENNDELESSELLAKNINWLVPKPDLNQNFNFKSQIRYRQTQVDSKVIFVKENNDLIAKVLFKTPQRAVAAGQGIMFYVNDVLVASGVIN